MVLLKNYSLVLCSCMSTCSLSLVNRSSFSHIFVVMHYTGVFMVHICFIFADTKKMPLGKLSKSQIAKGIEVSAFGNKKYMWNSIKRMILNPSKQDR